MWADNLWYNLLQENLHLFSDENKIKASIYDVKVLGTKHNHEYSNFFNLDGRSYEYICDLIDDLHSKKEYVVLPKLLKKDEPTVFFNNGEGHAPTILFYALHKLIEVCHLTGPVAYKNSSVNVSEIYEEFCTENQTLPKMLVAYTGNPGFSNPSHPHYSLPDTTPFEILPVEQQKLYCSFNWNPWDHRMCLIALLHYYDLLPDGYVTSPGDNKFKYNLEKDFAALKKANDWYCKVLPEYESIMEKLETLKNNYPLQIDDRTQYKDTDTPLNDKYLKLPLHKARLHSLFEIVAETRFTKEHWFSEKTYWPLKLGKPFLLINGSGSLKSLKKLGYKTFDDLIDESYDEEKSTPHKIQQVVLEMKRLKELREKNPIGFYEMYDKLEEIGKHNSEVFKRGHAYL